jgi:hypothetical protein
MNGNIFPSAVAISPLFVCFSHISRAAPIDAVGPQGYDFFAAQIPSSTSRRVRPAITNSLLSHGQPEAFVAYFAELRQESQKKDALNVNPRRHSLYLSH